MSILFNSPVCAAVFGPDGAFPCSQQASWVMPQKLPLIVLFSGVQDLTQQVVTIVNVAGQAISGMLFHGRLLSLQ